MAKAKRRATKARKEQIKRLRVKLWDEAIDRLITKLAEQRYWSLVRQAVLERDKFTCQRCGKALKNGRLLDVHHIVPRRKGGGDALDNLVTLCHACHPTVEAEAGARVLCSKKRRAR